MSATTRYTGGSFSKDRYICDLPPVTQQEQEIGDADDGVEVQVCNATVLVARSPRCKKSQKIDDSDYAVAGEIAIPLATEPA